MKAMEYIKKRDIVSTHPCFSEAAHSKFGRVHLPVAPACNIQCRYCIRKYDCANESRPGITSRVLRPSEAMERVRLLVERNTNISVIGIAGPGEALANDATFDVFRTINREFPELTLCLSTNGLMLSERIEDIIRCGVKSITITINALRPETAEGIYSHITYRGKTLKGKGAAELLLFNQYKGLRNAIDAGLIVKVNTVLIPGVNDEEITQIAYHAGQIGADLMNIIPLIPQAEFANIHRPSHIEIDNKRKHCEGFIPQMTHCKQCRADAFGILTEDKDMELEVLNACIGEEYCDMVNP